MCPVQYQAKAGDGNLMASLLIVPVVRMTVTYCTLSGLIVPTMLTKIKVLQSSAPQTLVLPLCFEKKLSPIVLIWCSVEGL